MLLVVLGVSLSRPDKVVEVIKHQTDSLIVVKHDTLTITKVVEVEKKVVDTVYVKSEGDSIPIPISEYRFFKPNEYDITARGFNVTMPSITVFPKTIIKTVTNTIEKETTVYASSIFVFGGFSVISDAFYPKMGVGLSLKGKWLISGDFTLYQKRPLWSCSVGYNILNR